MSVASHLGHKDAEGRKHCHTSVLDLCLAPELDVSNFSAIGQAKGVEDLVVPEIGKQDGTMRESERESGWGATTCRKCTLDPYAARRHTHHSQYVPIPMSSTLRKHRQPHKCAVDFCKRVLAYTQREQTGWCSDKKSDRSYGRFACARSQFIITFPSEKGAPGRVAT